MCKSWAEKINFWKISIQSVEYSLKDSILWLTIKLWKSNFCHVNWFEMFTIMLQLFINVTNRIPFCLYKYYTSNSIFETFENFKNIPFLLTKISRPFILFICVTLFWFFQVNIPKSRKTYCPACNNHQKFKVTQYKKSQESKFAQGRRRYDRKQQGFGGQSKPILRKKVRIIWCFFL